MVRWPPWYAKQLENLPLILAFDQAALRDPLPVLSSKDILPQPSLIQTHPVFACQQPNTPVEDVVTSEVYESSADLVPGHQQKIDTTPHSIPRKGSSPVPFATVVFSGGRQTDPEVALVEQSRYHDLQHCGSENFEWAIRFCDDEVDIARVRSTTSVGSPNCELNASVDLAASVANIFVVVVHLLARYTSLEVTVVFDANLLILCQLRLVDEVVNRAMALVNPLGWG